MTPDQIRTAVARLETTRSSEEEEAWSVLRSLGMAVIPFLYEAYPNFRKWQGRVSLVFHSIRYARLSEDAFQLGLAALNDRATLVRYRACSLLAYALRDAAAGPLERILEHADPNTVAHAGAALDAIHHRNHHLFVDRDHSGRTFWTVNPGDTIE